MIPVDAFSAEQVRARDAEVIAAGTTGYSLMLRAAQAAFDVARSEWPTAHRYTIVCGAGNNGGDGYVFARLAHCAGLSVKVFAAVETARLRGDAARALADARAAGVEIESWSDLSPAVLSQTELIVDALLGTGVVDAVREPLAGVIAAINAAGVAVLALDLPSGLCADTGLVRGVAVHAQATVTFIGVKSGAWLQAGPEHCGAVHYADLGVGMPGAATAVVRRIDDAQRREALPPRTRTAHKSQAGRVLVVGGRAGMSGAVRLAGEAALRVGAGLVTVLTAPESIAAVAVRSELMVYGSDDPVALAELSALADVIVVGPGMSDDTWSQRMCEAVLLADRPMLVDAGALRWLARHPQRARCEWILTPHPGEAAQLLGYSQDEGSRRVQADRMSALHGLRETFGGTIVLKGAGTLVARDGECPQICLHGNPGMAVPGMGDVLSGAIAGLWAQCRDPWRAARVGVLVHALAGDSLAPRGERGLLAGEVAAELRHWVNP